MTCPHMDPSGTIWDMSPERRPRIPDELAARIDAARGAVPFERFVRDALTAALPSPVEHNVDNYLATLREDMGNSMALDHVGGFDEWLMFKEALALWVQEQEDEWDQVALDQEHDG